MPFSNPCFETYALDAIPLHRDLFLMDVVWMEEWEAANVAREEGDRTADPYSIGSIVPVSAVSVQAGGVELRWFCNTYDRWHELKTVLPASAFVVGARAWNYDKRPTIFVQSDWIRRLLLRANSIFLMVDVIGMTAALDAGRVSREQLLALRSRIDAIAAAHPDVSFISFADTLLLKTNWVAGIYEEGVEYSYRPETLLDLFGEVRAAYRGVLGLGIYGVFAQGSNEYYDDPLLHISDARNHISLNSLGLPFAQISLIEHAARAAIRNKTHGPSELYLDEDFFHSLNFVGRAEREVFPSATYQPKLSAKAGKYYLASCDDVLARLKRRAEEQAQL
jgi:hypothetical protein